MTLLGQYIFAPLQAYLHTGGPVMLPILLVCLLMWFLILDRVLVFRRLLARRMTLDDALAHIRSSTVPTVQQRCCVLGILVREFQRRRGDKALDGPILDETVLYLSRRMTQLLTLIGVLAAIAPLLGLLGTVTGMMKTFDVLAVFGTGNAKALASGISEALITTQSGLLVAIPGLYMKSFLQRRAESLTNQLCMAGYYLKRQLRSGTSDTIQGTVQLDM